MSSVTLHNLKVEEDVFSVEPGAVGTNYIYPDSSPHIVLELRDASMVIQQEVRELYLTL